MDRLFRRDGSNGMAMEKKAAKQKKSEIRKHRNTGIMAMEQEMQEFIEVTKQIEELTSKLVPLYNKQQILLVKLKAKWKRREDASQA